MTDNSLRESFLNKSFISAFWALAKPYWFSDEKWVARGLLGAILALNLALVYMQVQFNTWNGAFYNALQEKNSPEFQAQLFKFTWLAAVYIVMAVYQLYLNLMLQIRWRRWLTNEYFDKWLAERVYYRLELKDYGTDNPDQRIAEDLRIFTSQTITLAFGLLRQIVTLVSFVGILWTLSGPLPLAIGGTEWTIPGYMVWAALVYSIVGTWLTHQIGRPLAQLNFDQQHFEADLRFNLVRLRENAEGVALYAGEADEKRGLIRRFQNVWTNWWELMKYQKRLLWFTAAYEQAATIFPILVAAPRYFSGAIQLGGLMQTASAFGRVQDALSWFISAYTELAAWRASVNRLISFHKAMDQAGVEARTASAIQVNREHRNNVTTRGLEVRLPNDKPLIEGADLDVQRGANTLIRGRSGSGKSTLFRALSGIWPFGRGQINVPADASVLFLPQKPYLPLGTLREVVCYPAGPQGISDERIKRALEQCKLEQFIPQLDRADSWHMRLSPGEQQRLAFARAVLLQPDWLFLDEATSALDEILEGEMYELLQQELPNTTLISIAHKATVARFHQQTLELVSSNGLGRLAPT